MYHPDGWKIIQLVWPDGKMTYRLAAGYSGTYIYGDSWRINSGITEIEAGDGYWNIHGETGSVHQITPHGEDRGMALHMAYAYLEQQVANGYLKSWSKVDSSNYLPVLSVITDEED